MADKGVVYGSTQPLIAGVLAGEGVWKADIFGCLNDWWPNCCMSFFCPCVSLAQTLHRVGIYKYSVALLIFGGLWLLMNIAESVQYDRTKPLVGEYQWAAVDTWAFAYLIFGVIYLFLVVDARAKIRKMFQVQGSWCEDFWCSLCCQWCVIAQMATQVEAYDKGECSFGPKDTLPGYNA
ncbi:hypothetical protein LEN26_017236 [Aphanomyces euteiches]|nr:hypothetical protein LEN26_017236 [Aphanomyces euteiches]KAH9127031.1 hypothetical protein AeMF1_002599 [Aphanomyces euteiches]KAH9131408.1 hypothetical protein AeNC1_019658 [Aphanomyces euteiches]